jgi:hypothetical protein
LTKKDHEQRFWDCIDFAGKPITRESAERIVSRVNGIETIENISVLIPLLISNTGLKGNRA